MIFSNPFIEVVSNMNGLTAKSFVKPATPYLRQKYRERQAALYITMQQVLDQLTKLLEPDEKIINFMPMTDEQNSQFATGGVMGMYHPKTTAAQKYMHEQDSLRGNRIMAFTNKRMIFFIVIEFLDDPNQYFSYEYSALHSIKLKRHSQVVPTDHRGLKRVTDAWYTLDFETDDRHIFTEILTSENGQLFKKNTLTIPAMKNISITDRVTRIKKLDMYFSNVAGQYGCFMWFGIIWLGGLALYFLWNWISTGSPI
ncbi:hypothetical protein [Lapidilactobacillus bayanensis]|uniref:hypothetical protein n=1 Tax=Lapidilactobacillus bayanensis TaxID=2485998 RepID=UPI000F7B09FD|nr:hypothetical protein [Lapidilactobacillus bayanensis]